MRLELGSLQNYINDLLKINNEFAGRLSRAGGLDTKTLIDLVANQISQDFADPEQASAADVVNESSLSYECFVAGEKAIKNGEVAFVVLAGGSGTRMGSAKALVKIPPLGISMLANKLMQSYASLSDGEHKVPTWIMTQPNLTKQLSDHINCLTPVPECVVFEQFESCRLKLDNSVDFVEPGIPNVHPCGHGDVGPALIESGVLDDNKNVKYVIVVNVDNVLVKPSAAIVGHHILSGKDVTCEVVQRCETDSGGCLAWSGGKLQILENFRISQHFQNEALFHNTNTMIISTSVFYRPIEWKWHRIRKHIENKIVIQHERLLQQYTSDFDSQYVLVDRNKRYFPVKTNDDLIAAGKMLDGNK